MKLRALKYAPLLFVLTPVLAHAQAAPQFVPFVMPWDDATPGTATDMTALNTAPAGSNGSIVARNGHFYESKTGKRIRFLGVGFSFHENYPTHEDAEKVAARLAKFGINIVRIHHHDDKNTAMWDKSVPGYTKFNPDAMDRLDYLIAQLKKHGIYVNLNLHVGRPYTPEAGFPPSVTKIRTDFGKRADQFNRQMIDFQKEFARQYLGRVNPYTGLAYSQDPCVASVEINNEDSLVWWISYNHPSEELRAFPEPFRGELMGLWNAWLGRKYGSTAAVLAAWGDKSLLKDGETLEKGTIDIPANFIVPNRADWIAFLIDTERAYADEMRNYLRQDLGVRAPITCSQIYYGGISGLYREIGSDFRDMHAYWNHPTFAPGVGWSMTKFHVDNTCMITDLQQGKGGTFRKMALSRVEGQPYTVSEYNETFPSDYQSEAIPVLATYAAQQDWDAIYLFDYGNYGHEYKNDTADPFFGIALNPAKMAYMPAAAAIFRGTAFEPAVGTTTLHLGQAALFSGSNIESWWSKAGGGKEPDLISDRLSVVVNAAGTEASVSRYRGAEPVASSIQVINTPSGAQYLAKGSGSQVASGYLGGQKVDLGAASFVFPTFGNNFATLTLTAMDGKVNAQSERLLLTVMGKSENTGQNWNADRTGIGDSWGQGPVLAEAISVNASIRVDGPRQVWALDTTGHRRTLVPSKVENGTLSFQLNPDFGTVWYEIVRQ